MKTRNELAEALNNLDELVAFMNDMYFESAEAGETEDANDFERFADDLENVYKQAQIVIGYKMRRMKK